MSRTITLGNNFYLLNGVIQHSFSSVFYDLKKGSGNITPQKWLLDRAKKELLK